jgi:CheY-like chemotaxis protein
VSSLPLSVLLVDDDEVEIIGIQRAFRKNELPYRLRVARDGAQALDIVRGRDGELRLERPFVVLLDLNMPRMNGFEFLRELRSDPVHHQAVVFVLTTSPAAIDRSAAYDQHVAGYIVKSHSGDHLAGVIGLLDAYARTVELP